MRVEMSSPAPQAPAAYRLAVAPRLMAKDTTKTVKKPVRANRKTQARMKLGE
jgi:hypothetical protein